MQLLTIVYRYGDDRYLLAADGGLIDSYRDRAEAERTADAIRLYNLAGYRVDGENPRMIAGEPYGRVFVAAIIGPRPPNPYSLPRCFADELYSLATGGQIPRFPFFPGDQAYALVAELRQLDPDDRGLLYSAERNDSASAYRAVIKTAQGDDPYRYVTGHDQRHYVHPDNLSSWIDSIAALCEEDGADRGFIPLIGGQPRAVWDALYAWLQARESEPLSVPVAAL